jgi:L-2,4-diaminobutyrate decarboxylase
VITAAEAPPLAPSRIPVPLAGTGDGLIEVAAAVTRAACGALAARHPRGPLPDGAPEQVLARVGDALGPQILPEDGLGTDAALHRVARVLGEHGIELNHPWAAAHLQPAPLAVAVAADTLASAGNASLDTYDSAASPIAVERWVIGVLAGMAGLGGAAGGVFTPGGSVSNLMALLLARDAAAARSGVDTRRDGVAALRRPVVLCSEVAHFSVHRACATLGLGEAAVHTVPVDERRRMRPDALAETLRGLGDDHTLLAVVATAGSTDFGSVDPLQEVAELAAEHGTWLHVDAAYGFGALFSARLAERVDSLALADSVTVDLHKIGWQPASASALLVRDAATFTPLDRSVAYLNPADDAAAGYDGLLGRSLQTTRRPDAVKVAATLLAYGRRGLGQMVDHCHELARHAGRRIAAEPRLELVAPAELTTVVFRYRTADPAMSDRVNAELRRRLLRSGQALIGRTAVRLGDAAAPESTCLKLTLLNPNTTPHDLDRLLDAVLDAGAATEAETDIHEGAA